nr:hypothetical protein [Tanacetum cinerariifolium]
MESTGMVFTLKMDFGSGSWLCNIAFFYSNSSVFDASVNSDFGSVQISYVLVFISHGPGQHAFKLVQFAFGSDAFCSLPRYADGAGDSIQCRYVLGSGSGFWECNKVFIVDKGCRNGSVLCNGFSITNSSLVRICSSTSINSLGNCLVSICISRTSMKGPGSGLYDTDGTSVSSSSVDLYSDPYTHSILNRNSIHQSRKSCVVGLFAVIDNEFEERAWRCELTSFWPAAATVGIPASLSVLAILKPERLKADRAWKESHKSPTKSLFDVGSSRISIFTALLFTMYEEASKVESCPSEIILDDLLALDSIVLFDFE